MALWNFGKTSANEPEAADLAGNGVASSGRDSALWQHAREGFFESATNGVLCAANPALARCFGHETSIEFLDAAPSLFSPGLFSDTSAAERLLQKLQTHKAINDYEIQINRKDGTALWTSWSIWPRGDNGSDGWGGSVQDISREKTAEERLMRHAWHDKTTGLADRNLFVERIGALLKRAGNRENSNQPQFAVVFLDLDRFKVVNDTLGHNAGDQLLTGIARRLEAVLRPNDLLARLGGDEFGILLDDITDIKDVTPLLDRIQKRLAMSLTIEGQEVYSNASIGVALGRRDERTENLMRNAEAAMYRAKEKGRGRYEVWTRSDKSSTDSGAMQLEADLRRAVERQEFRCFYQPLVSLATGRVIGFESLVRWFHPKLGKVSPGRFIPIAEDTGLINQIGHWVLRESCRQLAVWQKRGGRSSSLIMSVNLSARQFTQPDLVKQVDRILQLSGIDGGSLKLEVTESALMDDPETAIKILKQFKAYGIKLSLDDFGTGYSSLSYLHRFPFNVLKIDQSFVSQMDAAEKNEEIVRTIVALAHTLHMDVIAEGVETQGQLEHLRALKCHFGQGYYFAGPLDAESATEMLTADPEW